MGLIVGIAFWGLMIAQLIAFDDGLDVLWDLGFFAKAAVYIGCMILGPLGAIAMVVVGYIGATDAWGWEWWQAALLEGGVLVLFGAWVALSSIGERFARRRG